MSDDTSNIFGKYFVFVQAAAQQAQANAAAAAAKAAAAGLGGQHHDTSHEGTSIEEYTAAAPAHSPEAKQQDYYSHQSNYQH